MSTVTASAGRGELPWLLRQLGVVLFVAYCLFNIANVLYIRAPLTFIGLLLIGIASVFLLQRLALLLTRGWVVAPTELYAYFLMSLLMAVVFTQQAFLDSHQDINGADTLQMIHAATVVAIVWMLIGGAVSMFNFKESFLLAILLAGTLLAMFLINAQDGFSVTYGEIKEEVGVDGINHLTLEKFVVPILALAYAFSPRARLLVVLMAFVTLFLMSGRTAFISFLIAVLLMSLQGRALRNFVMIFVAVVVIGLSVRIGLESGFIDTDNRAVREMVFMDGLEEDNSFAGRRELLLGGLEDLPEQFLFGNYPLTVQRFGEFGNYIHNILSAWQMYGFFVMVAILTGLGICIRRARVALRADPSPTTIFGAFMLIYVVIGALLAKSVLWVPMWLMLGFWLLRPNHSAGKRPARRRRRRRLSSSSGAPPRRMGPAMQARV